MKNIIIATLNSNLNKKLNENKEINIICKDILYKEGIFEILEKNKDIDFIIIDSELPGEFKIEEVIFKINKINRKIKIIYLINENEIRLDKADFNEKVVALNDAVCEKNDSKMADAFTKIIVVFENLGNVAKAVITQ